MTASGFRAALVTAITGIAVTTPEFRHVDQPEELETARLRNFQILAAPPVVERIDGFQTCDHRLVYFELIGFWPQSTRSAQDTFADDAKRVDDALIAITGTDSEVVWIRHEGADPEPIENGIKARWFISAQIQWS